MKKIILISVLCFLSSAIIAQMSFSSRNFITETVDEFGDKTGEVKVGISAKGYFSNSATTNSCAELIISITKNLSWADLYEYCGNHPSSDVFNITFEGVATKEHVDAKITIPIKFVELCKNNDTIKVRMNESSQYGTTSAVFKLFNCKKFYADYVRTFGTIEYALYQKRGGNLYVYNREVAIPEKCPASELPVIEFWKKTEYYNEHISFGGYFKNGSYIATSGEKVLIDGKVIEKEPYLCKPYFNEFMKYLRSGSIVEVYHKDGQTKETFEITPELYEVITNFFK